MLFANNGHPHVHPRRQKSASPTANQKVARAVGTLALVVVGVAGLALAGDLSITINNPPQATSTVTVAAPAEEPANVSESTPEAQAPEPCGKAGAGLTGGGPFEPNESQAAARGPLLLGESYRAKIETQTDEDWFTFCLPSQGQVVLEVAGLGPKDYAPISFEVVDTENEEREVGSTGTNERSQVPLSLGAGQYYINLSSYCCDALGRYKISVVRAAPELSPTVPPAM